jgi:hypothetical protein
MAHEESYPYWVGGFNTIEDAMAATVKSMRGQREYRPDSGKLWGEINQLNPETGKYNAILHFDENGENITDFRKKQ